MYTESAASDDEVDDASPSFSAYYGHYPVKITCDSGATSSLFKHAVAVRLGMPISPTLHTASQADGKTKMSACGEIHVTITKGSLSFMGGGGVTSAWSPLGNFLEGQAHSNLSSNQVFLFFCREVFCFCFPVVLRLLCSFSNSF